jgi:prophage antirepressor-like protein
MKNENTIIPFGYGDKLVRVVKDENGEPLWVAKDVCDVLGYQNVSKTLDKLDEDEKGVTICYTLGGKQEMLVINEPGFYKLVFRSNKQEAKAFTKWVTSEVLPTIRKTGSYTLNQRGNTDLEPDLHYQGGKVAHIIHKHNLNPSTLINVKVINKLEKMFGAKEVREFYSELLGIEINEVLRELNDTDDDVKLFVKDKIQTDTTRFVKIETLYDTFNGWIKTNGIVQSRTLSKVAFSRSFATATRLKAFQQRFGNERARVFRVEIV